MVGGKVDGQILFGARSEKPKMLFDARGEKQIYLVPNDSYEKFYLAVKGLKCFLLTSHATTGDLQIENLHSMQQPAEIKLKNRNQAAKCRQTPSGNFIS